MRLHLHCLWGWGLCGGAAESCVVATMAGVTLGVFVMSFTRQFSLFMGHIPWSVLGDITWYQDPAVKNTESQSEDMALASF